jgi:hypothetical protein
MDEMMSHMVRSVGDGSMSGGGHACVVGIIMMNEGDKKGEV